MIFGALGLLVIGAVLLVAGVAKSSVTMAIGSLVCALLAGALLLAASAAYRRRSPVAAQGAAPVPAGTGPGPVAWSGNGNGTGNGYSAPAPVAPAASVPEGYDGLAAKDVVGLLDALSLDELHAVRRHEIEHEHRKTVLQAVDRRIETVVEKRKQLTGS